MGALSLLFLIIEKALPFLKEAIMLLYIAIHKDGAQSITGPRVFRSNRY